MRVDDRILFSLRSPSIVRRSTNEDQDFSRFSCNILGASPRVGAQSPPFVSLVRGHSRQSSGSQCDREAHTLVTSCCQLTSGTRRWRGTWPRARSGPWTRGCCWASSRCCRRCSCRSWGRGRCWSRSAAAARQGINISSPTARPD
jgi:hypothetical protein